MVTRDDESWRRLQNAAEAREKDSEDRMRTFYERTIRALVLQREHCREQCRLAHSQGSYLRETHWASMSQGTAHAIEEVYRIGLATFTPEPDPPPPAGMTEWPPVPVLQQEADELRLEAISRVERAMNEVPLPNPGSSQ